MILRSLVLRHGRLALPRPPTPNGTLIKRTFTTSPCIRQQAQAQAPEPRDSQPPILPSEIRDNSSPVASDWAFYHHQKARTKTLGSELTPYYKPSSLLYNPPRPQDITLELLLASQTHIGHATSLWHPANARYIFGVRGRKEDGEEPIHVISLDVTAAHLRRACKIVRGVASRGGLILFVGTRSGQSRIVVRAARLAQGCHLFTNWIPGSITNGQQILGSCQKVVVDENDEPIPGFADQLSATSVLKPDLVVCLNPTENYTLLHECGMHGIPTIGIVDTNANPTWLTYPIPANDDSLRAVHVIAGALGRAGEEGQAIRRAQAKQGIVVSMPSHGLEPPREGQVETEQEAAGRDLLAKKEDDERWAAIAKTVPGGSAAFKLEKKEFEIDESALEAWDMAGALPEAPRAEKMRESGEQDVISEPSEDDVSMEELDLALSEDMPEADFGAEEEEDVQPYERDRALSEEELAQAPSQPESQAQTRLQDEMSSEEGEDFGFGIQDKKRL